MLKVLKMNDEIQKIESWFQKEVSPCANELDSNCEKLAAMLQKIGDRSWLALKAPVKLGGMGMKEIEYRRLQISLARASGALTFLQTQHQSAVAKLAQSKNISLRELFPQVAQGKSLIGVGFSHLRRRGTPMMLARATAGGYLLTGKVPWITGYGFFSQFILGATLDDGRELYGILPLENTVQDSGGEIACSEPMALLAATATNTVSAEINQWYLSSDRLVSINPPGAIHHSSQQNILNHGFFALGCAYAGLDLLQTIAQNKQLEFLYSSWEVLHQEVTATADKAIALISQEQSPYSQRLQLRAETIDLAQRCSLAAVVASSGAANYLHSTVGRVYREALLFSVAGQTKDVIEASLKQLLSNQIN